MAARASVGVCLVVFAFTGCKSFRLAAEAADSGNTDSAYILVGQKEELKCEQESELFQLVDPERRANYLYYAQLVRRPTEWELAGQEGSWPSPPDIDDLRFSLKVTKSQIDASSNAQIALLVQFQDGHWKCKRAMLVPKGMGDYIITPSDLISRQTTPD